ncbi:MAG: UDP-N-acetylmuramoyl-L-alanine--D-glutamate ligase [Bacteroidales bacterium]|nr:UDP-N-acetylmuramoyl-L-alanine--D-glutamate ligase [Bacteroidales bacterium]
MYKENELRNLLGNKKILIAGYGREGKSTERLLKVLDPDRALVIVEGNDNIRREAKKGYDLILKSPGIPMCVFEGLCDLSTISSQTDIFLQLFGNQAIGITGTKGKSTTTNLVYSIMRSHYGSRVIMAGNMGVPLFDIVDRLDSRSMVVCELSCHQLENIHCSPHIGVVLNLFQEHLDHYHSYLDYQMAKMNIGLHQHADDYFFYCNDNKDLRERVEQNQVLLKGNVISYDLDEAKQLQGIDSPLQGDHNRCNILVAYYVSLIMKVPRNEIVDAINGFQGLEHRLERVGVFRGITFYDDSISTIPEACMAAIKALNDVDTLILGGYDRGIDYGGLMAFLETSPVRNIAFVGKAGERMIATAGGDMALKGRNVLREDDYGKIVYWCFEHTEKGKSCLLSPAAASYDAFKNFEERGQVFKELVKAMGKVTCQPKADKDEINVTI